MSTSVLVGLIGLGVFLLLLVMGMSIAGSMTIVGFLGYAYLKSFGAAASLLTMDFFSSFNSYNMSVVAMFTWMGYIAYHSGIGEKLFDFAYECFLLGKHTVERVCSGLSPLRRDRLWC